jgi:hypothetical protein
MHEKSYSSASSLTCGMTYQFDIIEWIALSQIRGSAELCSPKFSRFRSAGVRIFQARSALSLVVDPVKVVASDGCCDSGTKDGRSGNTVGRQHHSGLSHHGHEVCQFRSNLQVFRIVVVLKLGHPEEIDWIALQILTSPATNPGIRKHIVFIPDEKRHVVFVPLQEFSDHTTDDHPRTLPGDGDRLLNT